MIPPKTVHLFKINGDILISFEMEFPLIAILSFSVLFVKSAGLLKTTGIFRNPYGGISPKDIF